MFRIGLGASRETETSLDLFDSTVYNSRGYSMRQLLKMTILAVCTEIGQTAWDGLRLAFDVKVSDANSTSNRI